MINVIKSFLLNYFIKVSNIRNEKSIELKNSNGRYLLRRLIKQTKDDKLKKELFLILNELK